MGTNPLCFGIPTDEEFPFVIDAATSVNQVCLRACVSASVPAVALFVCIRGCACEGARQGAHRHDASCNSAARSSGMRARVSRRPMARWWMRPAMCVPTPWAS